MSTASLKQNPIAPSYGAIIEPAGPGDLTALDQETVAALIRERGALLLRGFGADRDAFTAFSARVCRDFSTYRGGGLRWGPLNRQSIDESGTVMTTTGSTQGFPLPLHGEMYYMRIRPRVLWFYCESPATLPGQGQTTLCDGHLLFAGLKPESQQYLRDNDIRYLRTLAHGEWQVAFQTEDVDELRRICDENGTAVEVDADGSIHTDFTCSALVEGAHGTVFVNNMVQIYVSEWAFSSGWVSQNLPGVEAEKPPIVVRAADGSPLPGWLIEDIRDVSEPLTYNIDWQRGDIAMVDNAWILHGRREAKDPSRNIFVRMGEPAFEM